MTYYQIVSYKSGYKSCLAYLPEYKATNGNLIEVDICGDWTIVPVETVVMASVREDEIKNLYDIGVVRPVRRVFAQYWQDDSLFPEQEAEDDETD